MTDEQLIEAMARAMFKDNQLNRLDIAKAALDACRPAIEALRAENARLRDALKDADTAYSLDLIIALRAENARLREALKPFADKAETYSGWAGTARDAVWFPISDLRAARAAMGESDE